MHAEEKKTAGRKPKWLKQVWFAGCHSDIGGSYLEPGISIERHHY